MHVEGVGVDVGAARTVRAAPALNLLMLGVDPRNLFLQSKAQQVVSGGSTQNNHKLWQRIVTVRNVVAVR